VAELTIAGFSAAKVCADEQSMVLVQPSRGAYPAPPPAYRGQDLGWLTRRLPHVARPVGTPFVPTVRLHLYTLHNGRFCIGQGLDGLVLTADERVVQEMSAFSELGRARAAQVTHGLSEADGILDDVFVGFDAAWGNWFHFLCFALARSALAASLLPSACRIALPDLTSRPATDVRFSVATWQQALEAFGLNQATLKLPPGIYRARRLRFLWTEPGAATNITYLAEFQRVFASIRHGLRGCPDLPRRLLVARNRVTDTRLEPTETDLLHRIAAEHGFVPMHFEAMDFRSQAAAMFNAEAVMGVHGAGLANLLFGRGNLRVLEINRSIGGESFPRPWCYLLAMARRQRYLVINRDAGELNAPTLHIAIDTLLALPAASHKTHVITAPATVPAEPREPVVLATVCNTLPNAASFALWLGRGSDQAVVDLGAALEPGDTGLTGLAWHEGQLYVAVQNNHKARIVVLDRHLCPVRTITDPRFVDLHSLTAVPDGLLITATGNGLVLHYRFSDHAIETLCTLGKAVHLNSACRHGDDLLVCCQSVAQIAPQAVADAPRGGGVFSMTERRVLVDGLAFPHSVMLANNGFVVLDSGRSRVLRFDRNGILQEQVLEGFLRGVCQLGDRLLVSSGPQRLVSRSTGRIRYERTFREALAERVMLYELDAATLKPRATRRISAAGFELYEVLALPGDALELAPERTLPADPTAFARLFFNAFIASRAQ
jgi:hypothetical protein